MGLTIKDWRGDQVKRLIAKELDQRMVAAGILMTNDIKESLSAKDNLDGRHPSATGEDPAKVTGALVGSIAYTYDPAAKRLRVGTSSLVGKWLELGTRFMAARPFLRNGWRRFSAKIGQVISGRAA